MQSSILLGYWGIRGRGQVLRLLLAYTEADWTQKKYFSQDEWKGIGKDQTSLGIPFPNLPYLIHDDLKLSESKAIMHYIINISSKKELLGKDIKDEAKVGNLLSVFTQIMGKLIELNLNVESYDVKKSEVENFLQAKLESFEQFFNGKNFALGYLTLADFVIAETSYYVENIFPQIYAKYQQLKTIRESFQSIEEIKAYYNRQTAVHAPFLPPIGKIHF